jgi:hypothetical protein
MDLLVLAYEPRRVNLSSQTADTPSSLAAPRETFYSSLANPVVSENRTQIVRFLVKTGRNVLDPENIQLHQLRNNAKYIFQTTPAAAQVGQYPPRGFREV